MSTLTATPLPPSPQPTSAKTASAIERLSLYLREDPNNPHIRRDLCDALMQQGQWHDALPLAQQGLEQAHGAELFIIFSNRVFSA